MGDRLNYPPEKDFGFYQRRKHDKWRAVPAPSPKLEAPVADSHAHIHMLPDPAWELARCRANGVDFVCMIVDPSEDGARPFEELAAWRAQAADYQANFLDKSQNVAQKPIFTQNFGVQGENRVGPENATAHLPGIMENGSEGGWLENPPNSSVSVYKSVFVTEKPISARNNVCIATGVHPHNAKLYDSAMEIELMARLEDPRVGALGEIGLDYHYDLSPRDVQRSVFRRQIALAKDAGLPIALHLRGGEDPVADDAHREAFDLLSEEGFPERGTLLHCCALPPEQLKPWVDAGCYIAYGGAITFKNAEAAREGARVVPVERLLLETDSPYMTPEPMRGSACTPAHVVFVAAALAEVRGIAPGSDRRAFLAQLYENTLSFYGLR